MKKKGEFLKTKEILKKRQTLFDNIKECRKTKEPFYININDIKYKIEILEKDELLFVYSDYLVYFKNKFCIARCTGRFVWNILANDNILKISEKRLQKIMIGVILEKYEQKK